MTHRTVSALIPLALMVLLPAVGFATVEPLTLYELDFFNQYTGCVNECAGVPACVQHCSQPQDKWDKDLSTEVDAPDYELALLEYWDSGDIQYICYQDPSESPRIVIAPSSCSGNCAVTPKGLCDAAECLETHSEEECMDHDGDGLRQWQEEALGTSDQEYNAFCNDDANTCTFSQRCEAVGTNSAGVTGNLCRSRTDCRGSDCTAFHLEQVSVNNNELIVRVHYDYSPVPATMIDVHVKYDPDVLQLIDTRPLRLLTQAGKELMAKHPREGLLRLVMFGANPSSAVPFGAVAELVFERTSGAQTKVEFSGEDELQRMSMAPDQGADQNEDPIREQLADDALWGDDIQVAAADPNGPRLLLYYSFDNPLDYLAYSDVMTGEELCEQFSTCSPLDNDIPAEKEQRDKIEAHLSNLQEGGTKVSELVDGVIGRAAYMDGRTDHLKFPITVNEPAPALDGSLYYDRVDQSFSLSTWFYSEGDDSLDIDTNGQILFSRNTNSETTRFGLVVRASEANPDAIELAWFEDDVQNGSLETVKIAELKTLSWTHVGMVVVDTVSGVDDDGDGSVDEADEFDHVLFYVNGALVGLDGLPQIPGVDDDGDGETDEGDEPATWLPFSYVYGDGFEMQCPAPQPTGGLSIHEEGDLMLSPGSPEVLFFASAENNLYGIEQMDLSGFGEIEIIREGDSSAKDPDYHPTLDKLVYSSSKSGNYEIWIADGDGSNPRQITKDFGDTSRGIFARRPKWAPDGSAIIFDSNVYSLTHLDNLYRRVYHLYYIAYDALANEVSIPVQGGGTVSELDYDFIASNQVIGDYRLTSDSATNHYDVRWKTGRDSDTGDRGVIWFNVTDPDYANKQIHQLAIPQNVVPDNGAAIDFETSSDAGLETDFSMLDAYRIKPAGSEEQAEMLYKETWIEYEDAVGFSLDISEEKLFTIGDNPQIEELGVEVTVTMSCTECTAFEIPKLYLEYDDSIYSSWVDGSFGGQVIQSGLFNKEVQISDNFTALAQSVKIRVLSEINNTAIPDGTEIAKIRFLFNGDSVSDDSSFKLTERTSHQQLKIAQFTDSETVSVDFVIEDDLLEFVTGAVFSPDGNRVALAGIQQARPVLLVSNSPFNILEGNTYVLNPDKSESVGFDKISTSSMNVEGMDWVPIERFYPCNWVGAYQGQHTRIFSNAFRGGLDELKLYSYAREGGAFQSDAERGAAWIEKEGDGGQPDPKEWTCVTDLDCPAYKLCDQDSLTCKITRCDPDTENSCDGRGICTLMPIPIGRGELLDGGASSYDWVCSVECASDQQCFTEECLNGPCRFCDINTWSCAECALVDHQISGEVTLSYIEGCPDRNSFACMDGSCVTECYAFENGESQYLCDPALEYCHQGRCKIFDWDWVDLAPASFSGLGETVYNLPGLDTTTAISQIYPIEITAFGVEDYLDPPELLVEGQVGSAVVGEDGADPYKGDWFKIGSVSVHNKTRVEAGTNMYTIHSPLPVSKVRMRLVTPPYENMNSASTGFDAEDTDGLCSAGGCSTCANWKVVPDGDGCMRDACLEWKSSGSCNWRAAGSRATMGYRVGIPEIRARRACAEKGYANCGFMENEPYEHYLYGGQPTVVIIEVKVAGKTVNSTVEHNRICRWVSSEIVGATSVPYYMDQTSNIGMNARMIFGDAQREHSNQKTKFYPSLPTTTLQNLTGDNDGAGIGDTTFILNCNLFASDVDATEQAGVQFGVCSNKVSCDAMFPTTGRIGSIVEEVYSCAIERGMRTTPCYEWTGADVTIDYMSYTEGASEPWHTLDFDVHRSFGYE